MRLRSEGTRQGIKFRIGRLAINSSEEFGFRGTWFQLMTLHLRNSETLLPERHTVFQADLPPPFCQKIPALKSKLEITIKTKRMENSLTELCKPCFFVVLRVFLFLASRLLLYICPSQSSKYLWKLTAMLWMFHRWMNQNWWENKLVLIFSPFGESEFYLTEINIFNEKLHHAGFLSCRKWNTQLKVAWPGGSQNGSMLESPRKTEKPTWWNPISLVWVMTWALRGLILKCSQGWEPPA